MERWKNMYPEDRLVCLARVFINIEFMGCRYPNEVMLEVSRLSNEVAEEYRKMKKMKLQRTFVSASEAAAVKAKGKKRKGGLVKGKPPNKAPKIDFVPQGQQVHTKIKNENNENQPNNVDSTTTDSETETKISQTTSKPISIDYLKELSKVKCVDVSKFDDTMFETPFGRFVLLINTSMTKLGNIQSSCQACKLNTTFSYEDNVYTIHINEDLIAEAPGTTKALAREAAEKLAWKKLKKHCVCLLVRENKSNKIDKLKINEVFRKKEDSGTKVENSVAVKMMKLMGWKGGGLGVDAQGIQEPIQPHLQTGKRSGLGSTPGMHHIRAAGTKLMKRLQASDDFDVELVFTNEFSKEERAALHKCAQNHGLVSKSYNSNSQRFLVVKKKLDPFSLVKAAIEKGGDTPKYKVFIPAVLAK
ncbi:NF-kappa-B-repressing factor [Danaus plexippus plexippus]|uniref:NF-kappa-B-repressing factor n=2 Tax=Danaus plexippus TaxID=13037 RepID=A0A212FCU6_DANPL|nr:NF-kappa-B-repressing factor [Danaus plexippus plexippus]